MKRQGFRNRFFQLALLFAAAGALLILSGDFFEALARVGGGHSYSGGGRSSGGSGGGGGGGGGGAIIGIVRLLFWLTIEYPAVGIPVDIVVIGGVIYFFTRSGKATQPEVSSVVGLIPTMNTSADNRVQGFSREFSQLRRFDPNFSEIIFTDFCYALYARAQEARGRKILDNLSPYLSQEARASLTARNPNNLESVAGVIVGAMQVADVRGLASPVVNISVEFEANYTEVIAQNSEMSYYVRERWEFERKRDLLSLPPAEATALHCPRCGAPLEATTDGACAYCGVRVESGEFQWYVRSVQLLSREARGPLLTSDVQEVGTDLPSVIQPGFNNVRESFERENSAFTWPEFQARAALIFNELQTAWSTLDWERARPHETDNIFQMHQYWIDAYKRQGLRNVIDRCRITRMQPVKIKEDAFYNAITLRIWAEGYDYTVNSAGKVVSGSNSNLRRWSEYWTFIRNRKSEPKHARADLNCPNCGAGLKVNAAGICQFCGGKITSGDFDWVLSKIEQDESYAG